MERLLARLQGVPPRIRRAIIGAERCRTGPSSGSDEWSAAEILAHMRASDDILSFRVYAILVRDNPPLPAYDERRWAAVAGYADSDFQASLEAFALRRDELVTMLRRAALDDWQRVGTLDGGETISIQRVVALLVDHEEEHCAQLEAHVQALKVPSPPRQ